MDDQSLDLITQLCREAAEVMDGQGSLRLRILLQMVLQELAKEQARRAGQRTDRPSNKA